MSRFLITIIVVVVLLGGAMFWLAGRNSEQPTVKIEKAVALENLS
jgi:hypothetical protein